MSVDYLEYDAPVMVNSTQEISVQDRYGVEVLTLQKYFKNKTQRILGGIMPGFYTNIIVRENAEIVAESKDIFTLGRNRWDVQYEAEDGTQKMIRLQDTRVVRTHPRASFHIGSDHYKLERNFGEKTSRLQLEDEIVAELTSDRRVPPRRNRIKFYRDDLNIPLFSCILHTYELTN